MTIFKNDRNHRKRISSHHQSLKNSEFPNGLQESIKDHKRSRELSIEHERNKKEASIVSKIKKEKTEEEDKPFMWGMDEESPRLKKKGQYEHLFLKVKLAKDEGFWKNSFIGDEIFVSKKENANKKQSHNKNNRKHEQEVRRSVSQRNNKILNTRQSSEQKTPLFNHEMEKINHNSVKNLRKEAFMKVRQWSKEHKQLSLRRMNMLVKQKEEMKRLKLKEENEMEKKKLMRRRKILQTLKKQSERQRFKEKLVSFSSRRSLKSLKSSSPKNKKENIKLSKPKSFRSHHKIGSQEFLPIPTSILSNKRLKEHQISNNWDSNGNDFNQEKKKLFRRKMFDIRLREKSMKLVDRIKLKDFEKPGIENIPESPRSYKIAIKKMEGNESPAKKQIKPINLCQNENKNLEGNGKRYVSNREIIERARQETEGVNKISRSHRSVLRENKMATDEIGNNHRLFREKHQHSSRI